MENVYIFFDDSTKIENDKVAISDIASVYCTDKTLQSKIRALSIYSFRKDETRVIITALKVFEIILSQYPEINIIPLGSTDIILEKDTHKPALSLTKIKAAFICLIIFFGGAFTIIAFNNDVQVHNVFSQIYLLITGQESDGFTALECSYAVGLAIGILVFYNHFGKKKLSPDPTPLEIEMRLYETNIKDTLIEGVKRSNKHIDVS